jgi:CRP-like cAMP-binding protein
MPWSGIIEPLLLKLTRRDILSGEEQGILRKLAVEPTLVPRQHDLVREGDRPNHSTLLVSGFAARYKVLEDGSRQITALHVAGDFVDLHSLLLKPMDHGVVTLSQCQVMKVPHQQLRLITEQQPHLSRLLWLNTLIDAAIHREWLVAMGRRTALSHTAHLLCEVYSLLEIVRRGANREFDFPVTQTELGDVLGLSTVHVNRVVQELRAKELISWKGTRVRILDWDTLAKIAEFNPTYLQLKSEPR